MPIFLPYSYAIFDNSSVQFPNTATCKMKRKFLQACGNIKISHLCREKYLMFTIICENFIFANICYFFQWLANLKFS